MTTAVQRAERRGAADPGRCCADSKRCWSLLIHRKEHVYSRSLPSVRHEASAGRCLPAGPPAVLWPPPAPRRRMGTLLLQRQHCRLPSTELPPLISEASLKARLPFAPLRAGGCRHVFLGGPCVRRSEQGSYVERHKPLHGLLDL